MNRSNGLIGILIAEAEEQATPVWVHDTEYARVPNDRLVECGVVRFAQIACSIIHILRLPGETRKVFLTDAVFVGEIERASAAGEGHPFFRSAGTECFTAGFLDRATLRRVVDRSPSMPGRPDIDADYFLADAGFNELARPAPHGIAACPPDADR